MNSGSLRTLVVSPILTTAALLGCSLALCAQDRVDFNREVRPILSDMCFKCHGPDAAERKAGLRLDRQDGAIAKLESGTAAIVPEKPEDGQLLARISYRPGKPCKRGRHQAVHRQWQITFDQHA